MNLRTLTRYLIPSGILFALANSTVSAHGPQLQITIDAGQIATREIILDGPYSAALTPLTSVYIMPIRWQDGIAYVRPNDRVDSITGLPKYISGPGVAFGYDVVDQAYASFAPGSMLSIGFAGGLQFWDGDSFDDAGATELKVYRGSDPAIVEPVENFAITSDDAPFDRLTMSAIVTDYGEEAHAAARFVMLGDGESLTSESPDGVYLASLQLSSTQADLLPSEPFYFVLNKNATAEVIQAAVSSLGVDPTRIQYVPEPTSIFSTLVLGVILAMLAQQRRRRR